MKKITVFLILCFILLFSALLAQEQEGIAWAFEPEASEEIEPWEDSDIIWSGEFFVDDFPEEIRGPFRINNRAIEFGLLGLSVNFSNDFFTVRQVFQETMVIDLDEFERGFRMNLGLNANPFFFNFNREDRWGFGFSLINFDLIGGVGLSGAMLTFNQAESEESDFFGAAFLNFDFYTFFHVNRFRVTISPTLYFPLAYMRPNTFSYSYMTTADGETYLNFGVDINLYTAFSMDFDRFDFDTFYLSARPGLDVSVGILYPLSEALGIRYTFPFLDFDVGLDFINIPVVPATMRDYMRIAFRVGSDDPLNFDFFGDEGMDMDDFFSIEDVEYLTGRQRVFRPFKIIASADWRPLGRPLLTISPSLGFAVNPLFAQSASLECGLRSRLDLGNLFLLTLGVGYHDRLWKNSVDLSLNFRAVQLDLGLSLEAPRFAKSWSGGGFGITTGFRFGW